MIRIREPQEHAFSEAAWDRFRDDLAARLEERYPAWTAPLPEWRLGEIVAAAVASARALGMAGDRTITVFVACSLVFGPPPWTAPLAEPLADRAIPPEVQHARFVALAKPALEAARKQGPSPPDPDARA